MPKALKKSCASQASISKYFGSLSSGTGGAAKTQRDCNLQKSKKRASQSLHHDAELLSKQARLSLQEDDGGLGTESAQREQKLPFSRDPAGLCPSTLEKLRGFTCTTVAPSGESRDIMTGFKNTCSESCGFSADAKSQHNIIDNHNDQLTEDAGDEQVAKQMFRFSQFAKAAGKEGQNTGRMPIPTSNSPLCRRSKSVYTPLEQQVIQLKEQHKDALLAVECGYKYRFFGDDAEIAAKVLNIFCHLDHHFMTCSIPTHRLFVHIRRLVSHGHKVGVVKQTETSAIKASGANKNTLFTRRLTALYTKSTLVGEDIYPVCSPDDVNEGGSHDVLSEPPDSILLCVSESWDKLKKQLTVGLVAVQPGTGEVQLDCFPDSQSRSELESRILMLNPVEILVPSDLSAQTQKLLQSITNASAQADDKVRVEKRDSAHFEFASAMNTVTEFYCHNQVEGCHALSRVASLESPVICCLGPLIQYLQEFNLERVLRSQSSFQHLSGESQGMILSAATIRNLEILTNQTDGGVRGSLLWVLDHTRTPFGRRLMRKWVIRPLTESRSIWERQDAVQEILESDSLTLNTTRSLLNHLPDLERGMCSIFNQKASTQEFYIISSGLCRLALELQALLPAIRAQIRSALIRGLLVDIPELLAPAHGFLSVLNEKAARCGNKTEIFCDLSGFPVLRERREQIQEVLQEIQDHRKHVRIVLKAPSLDYTTVAGQEFLIEVKNSQSSIVPRDWNKVSSTKAVGRYHSPFVVERLKKLLQLREQLLLDCQREWTAFMDQFGEHYHTMKRAIRHLATMDCLFSLAEVAKHGDHCRPEVSDSKRQIMIKNGRHPAIDLLMGDHSQYVPNHVQLQADGKRAMIITGPNMGGKSSYIRQVALICIMAQMGSYVPSSEAHLAILDGIYTRMGASDNIYKGRSTFMEELTEASEIISHATERSLVILDELGRGTSTHDGIAIAYATLEYFIRDVRSFTLFVTHYPPLCELERVYPRHVSNYHMSFILNEPDVATDTRDEDLCPEFITFLYQLSEGAAGRSYGLNVARLADISGSILQAAALKARELEDAVDSRRRKKKLLSELWSISDKSSFTEWLKSNS
ncbi:DNA mismatch repair protein Msh3 isoform X1 [Syngnathus acus]|uniref:DNA mismatch repair protein Msh3 isoform X1 n=1 Tax=Syngnathus acus TaxID=161584 RepID=UPI001885E0B9|nr:DNA mismatch repair protein Msh3 isoform X1 [Syngnathus acus]